MADHFHLTKADGVLEFLEETAIMEVVKTTRETTTDVPRALMPTMEPTETIIEAHRHIGTTDRMDTALGSHTTSREHMDLRNPMMMVIPVVLKQITAFRLDHLLRKTIIDMAHQMRHIAMMQEDNHLQGREHQEAARQVVILGVTTTHMIKIHISRHIQAPTPIRGALHSKYDEEMTALITVMVEERAQCPIMMSRFAMMTLALAMTGREAA